MKIHGLSCVWNKAYVERFLQGTIKSLAFQHNALVMQDLIYNIFTEEEHFQEIEEFITPLLPHTELRLRDLAVIRDRIDYLHSGLIWQIKECLKEKTKMLLLPPDSIFGDGTLANLIKLGKKPGTCVVAPHPRVLPTILNESYQSNASLVTAAWKHLHRSWSEAEDGSDRQNSFVGGVRWAHLTPKLLDVEHLLPTPYFCDFLYEDLMFFESSPGIGVYDHTWPSNLVSKQRMKYSGSSDACFIAEITEHDRNLPPVIRGAASDKFWRSHPHNLFNTQISCSFRME